MFPCVVGRPLLRYEESLQELELWSEPYHLSETYFLGKPYNWRLCSLQDIVVGAACADLRHQLDVSYPVTNGIVQNWDDMGHIWDHAFYSELKVYLY